MNASNSPLLTHRKSGDTPKRSRARRNRKARVVAADDCEKVFARHHGICIGLNVSPVCKRWAEHPHEIIPVGAGGQRISRNRVPICSACHREVQGRVGGNRLVLKWPGKEDGQPPNADNMTVWAEWKD